jgi:hypothetical protein
MWIQTSMRGQWVNLFHDHSNSNQIKYHVDRAIAGFRLLSNKDDSFSGGGDTIDPSGLLELMSPAESVKPDEMSASTLAYLGDVVFELFIRSRYVWPERRMSDLQNKVVSIVRGTCPIRCLVISTKPHTSLPSILPYKWRLADAQAILLKK